MVTSPEEEKSEVRSCCEIQLQELCPHQVTMRTESEEREVVDGGAHVPPQAEEARKPDPCTEVGLMVITLVTVMMMILWQF